MKSYKRFSILILLVVFLVFLFKFSDEIGRLLYPVKYEHHIMESSGKFNVDPFLVAAIIKVESNFNPESVSSQNASGLMQIMPDTADWIIAMGNFEQDWKDKLNQPEINIEMGTKYLQLMSMQFDANMRDEGTDNRNAVLAASYNAGAGNVTRWLEEGVWDGKYETRENIPFGETRHYVRRVHYYYNNYADFYADKWREVLN